MMKIPTLVIKISFLILFSLFSNCSEPKYTEVVFNQTIEKILEASVGDYENRPPTFKEFKADTTSFKARKIDTINNDKKRLKIDIDTKHIQFDYSLLEKKLPKDFRFLYEPDRKNHNYIPTKIENFDTCKYAIRFVNNFDKKEEPFDEAFIFGGYIQFSKVTMNEVKSKGAIFMRIT